MSSGASGTAIRYRVVERMRVMDGENAPGVDSELQRWAVSSDLWPCIEAAANWTAGNRERVDSITTLEPVFRILDAIYVFGRRVDVDPALPPNSISIKRRPRSR